MFKLFGKKKEEPKPRPAVGKNPELAALGAQFEAKEITILAVTGPDAFRGSKDGEDQLWRAGMELTAWMEEDGPVVREPARLVALADDTLMTFLRQRTPRDGIIRAKVRRGKEDSRFLLVDIPEPAMEPELKAIQIEQKKPVAASDPELGIFLLDRSAGWFAAEKAWCSGTLQLTFDDQPDKEGCFRTARALFADPTGWDARLRDFAADQLLEQANDWAGEEDAAPVTREEFLTRLEPESIHVFPDGRFEVWFNDGELFWGHGIHLLGDLDNGPVEARMEG